jgi:hypothetical protein
MGVIASPYQLKMQSLADQLQLNWQRWPDQAGRMPAIVTATRLHRARKAESIERWPARIPGLDEYPSVPYYSLDGKQFFYDSSGLALLLDSLKLAPNPLVPLEPGQNFICKLIDEAFDEFGLYMVHHHRWVTSATTNCMGEMTSKEMRHLLPFGLRSQMARKLPRRQARSCCASWHLSHSTGYAPYAMANTATALASSI